MARKTPRGLVALSASAVAAIYVAGYLSTQAADARLTGAAAADSVTAAPPAAPAESAPTRPAANQAGRSGGARSTPATSQAAAPTAPAAAPTPATTAAYLDGTYTGTGSGRHGGVDVAVTVQAGRIADVQMTRVWTQYPASRIAGLPAQVVAHQSAQVDRISGATSSVQAFQAAVQQALAKART